MSDVEARAPLPSGHGYRYTRAQVERLARRGCAHAHPKPQARLSPTAARPGKGDARERNML